jgi:hypothetical protein
MAADRAACATPRLDNSKQAAAQSAETKRIVDVDDELTLVIVAISISGSGLTIR